MADRAYRQSEQTSCCIAKQRSTFNCEEQVNAQCEVLGSEKMVDVGDVSSVELEALYCPFRSPRKPNPQGDKSHARLSSCAHSTHNKYDVAVVPKKNRPAALKFPETPFPTGANGHADGDPIRPENRKFTSGFHELY